MLQKKSVAMKFCAIVGFVYCIYRPIDQFLSKFVATEQTKIRMQFLCFAIGYRNFALAQSCKKGPNYQSVYYGSGVRGPNIFLRLSKLCMAA